jgi:hypothetical protein
MNDLQKELEEMTERFILLNLKVIKMLIINEIKLKK